MASLCSLRYHLLPQVHELEEGKIPMRALNPKSPKAGSTCFTCQKLGDGLGPTVLVKARAWHLTIYFRVGDLTGMIGGWELNLLILSPSEHWSSYWYLHWRRVHRLWLTLGQRWSGYSSIESLCGRGGSRVYRMPLIRIRSWCCCPVSRLSPVENGHYEAISE
jgi:hypothetical protein